MWHIDIFHTDGTVRTVPFQGSRSTMAEKVGYLANLPHVARVRVVPWVS